MIERLAELLVAIAPPLPVIDSRILRHAVPGGGPLFAVRGRAPRVDRGFFPGVVVAAMVALMAFVHGRFRFVSLQSGKGCAGGSEYRLLAPTRCEDKA